MNIGSRKSLFNFFIDKRIKHSFVYTAMHFHEVFSNRLGGECSMNMAKDSRLLKYKIVTEE